MNKKYIFDKKNLALVEKKISKAENIFLFLDYDGTLAPFKNDPLTAFVLPEIKKSLDKLEKSSKYHLSLVSGRKLNELKKMVNLSHSNYAGSHGLEIDMVFKKEVIYPHQNKKNDLLSQKNYQKVKEKFLESEAVELEDKGFGFALHFESELKQKKAKKELKNSFKGTTYEVLFGRKIIEIRPEGWDKGKAVNYISEQIKANLNLANGLRVYIGDDRTDEDAFKVLKNGITIYVQNEDDLNTEAEFYLKNPADTAELLKKLAGAF